MSKFKVGDFVENKFGNEREIIGLNGPEEFPVVAKANNIVEYYTEDGQRMGFGKDSNYSLIPNSHNRTVNMWVNVYPSHVSTFYSASEASEEVYSNVLAVAVPVTFEVKY